MELRRALSQIQEIHQHLARTEVYRGYRSVTMAFTGMLALVGATLEPLIVPGSTGLQFVSFWVMLATANLLVVGGDILFHYWTDYSPLQRKMTARVVSQFLPCLAIGGLLTWVLCNRQGYGLDLLPGLWSLLFSMGIFASRPFLPQGIGFVGLFYLVAGTALVVLGSPLLASPWAMGAVFGPGQLFMSAVLYWNLERRCTRA